MHNISFQYELRPEIPNVYGTLDYTNFKGVLPRMNVLNQKYWYHID